MKRFHADSDPTGRYFYDSSDRVSVVDAATLAPVGETKPGTQHPAWNADGSTMAVYDSESEMILIYGI